MKRGQSAIELSVVTGFALVLTVLVLGAVEQNLLTKTMQQRTLEIGEIASNVESEISIAHSAGDGYSRNFTLPSEVANTEYNVTLVGKGVYVYTLDEKNALSIPIENVSGSLIVGVNRIRNVGGKVYLN